MKKISGFIAALALVAIAASCEKARIAAPAGEETTVEFTVATPQIFTKAIADGNTVDKVACNVYDGTGALIENAEISKIVPMTGGKATFAVRLVTGQTYSFIFWAYKDGTTAYALDAANKKVTVSYTDAAANDETRDAFYAYVAPMVIKGAVNETVTLYRPFAQLNFGVNKEDIAAAQAAGIEVKKSAIKVGKIGNELDLVEGTVSGEVDAEFTLEGIPTEDLKVKGVDYGYVAMNYVLVGKEEQQTADVELTVAKEDGTVINTTSVPNVPLRGNYRTNILGNLFTSAVNFNIVVDPAFEDEELVDLVNINCLSALQALFINGGSARLVEDFEIDETLVLNAGKGVVLDLNGHSISNSKDIWDKKPDDWSLVSVRGGQLVLKGEGKLQAKENDCYAIDVQDGGELIVEGGEYVGNITAVYVHTGKATIKGGKYSIQQTYVGGQEYEFVLNCYDASRTAGTASISVTGGEFVKFNPQDCDAEGEGTNFCAEGYKAVETSTGIWTVGRADAVFFGDEFAAAFAAAPTDGSTTTITLSADIDGNGVRAEAGQNVIIDMGGHTFDMTGETVGSSGTQTQVFQLLKGSKVTFKNGTIKSDAAGVKMYIQNYSDLTLENMVLDASKNSNVRYVLSNNHGTVNIIGSTSILAAEGKTAFDVYYWPPVYADGVNVTVNTTGEIRGNIEYACEAGYEADCATKSSLVIENATLVNSKLNTSLTTPNMKIAKTVFADEAAAKAWLPANYRLTEDGGYYKAVK